MIDLPTLGRLATAACGAVLLAACGDGSGPTPPLTGTYSLRTVNGHTLPASYDCGSSIADGSLTIAADSVLLRVTTGQGADASTIERHLAHTPTADGKQLVPLYEGSVLKDTVIVVGGGRVTYRAWLPVSAATCGGYSAVQAALGFTHD